jgi:tripartite-type tricarboxylate transporter receptor subunit TctC
MQRSFVAPPGMSAEATAYYTAMLEKLSASAEWQEYAKESALLTDVLTGDDLQAYFLGERDKHVELLTALGEAVVN